MQTGFTSVSLHAYDKPACSLGMWHLTFKEEIPNEFQQWRKGPLAYDTSLHIGAVMGLWIMKCIYIYKP